MIGLYETRDARRVHGKEGIFAFRCFGRLILQNMPKDSCIVGGYVRDMLIQDACASKFLSKDSSYSDFSNKQNDPDTYLGRTLCPKDIDIIVPTKLTTLQIGDILQKALSGMHNVEIGTGHVCLDNQTELSRYLSVGNYVDQVHAFNCVYKYGGLASSTKMCFKIDVITLKRPNSRLTFQQDCPFSSDSYVALVNDKIKITSPQLLAMRPITELFIFENDHGQRVYGPTPDMCAMRTQLQSWNVKENVHHALNVLTRVATKTKQGWKVDGLSFKIDENLKMLARGNQRIDAVPILEKFWNNYYDNSLQYKEGKFENESTVLRLFRPPPPPALESNKVIIDFDDEWIMPQDDTEEFCIRRQLLSADEPMSQGRYEYDDF